MPCHIVLDRAYQRGEKVKRGQQLATIGAPGEVGNNGLAHVHPELHRGGRSSDPVPFSPSNDGVLLDGVDLPFTGATGQNLEVTLTSSNTLSTTPLQPAASAPAGTHCAAAAAPRFVFGFAELKARLRDAMGEPLTCEFADRNGSGDMHQLTTRGLAFSRKRTNTPTFTNGCDHWGAYRQRLGAADWAELDPPIA
jgi:hypothetical protein